MAKAAAVTLAAATLVLLSPVLLLIAAAVFAESGRPVFYRERRLGLAGRPFTIIKFRTLKTGSGERGLVAPRGDVRVTRVGRILRRYHLDELPQLVNILRGDMAFVGPRPARAELWTGVPPELRARALSFRPGMSSPASLRYLCEDELLATIVDPEMVYREVLYPMKVAVDLGYFENRAPADDWRVAVRTLAAVFLGRDRAECRRRLAELLHDSGVPATGHAGPASRPTTGETTT